MSNSIFQNVVGSKKHYNNFPLGREILLTGQIGKLIPIQCDEVVPGDYFKQDIAFLCRFSPLSAPAMARFSVHFHSFYVPYRIITPETSRESTYEKFMKSIGKHSSEVPTLPYIIGQIPYAITGSLSDYLGLPVKGSTPMNFPQNLNISAMPFLAYQRIYQDFYRRDQIESEVVYPSNVSAINNQQFIGATFDDLEENQVKATPIDLFKLQTRNYERDYFTSALPEPQFGDEVSIGDGNIQWIGNEDYIPGISYSTDGEINNVLTAGWRPNSEAWNGMTGDSILGFSTFGPDSDLTFGLKISDDAGKTLAGSLQGNSITINEFRLAMQLQGIKEKINRVGTRYLEIMQGIYGVRVPDARLQRPIFLGGFKESLTIGAVMQTSQTTETSKQGTLTGQMTGSGSSNLVRGGYQFKEHGYLMTIMSITPRTSYYGGIPRKFLKKYPEEFYLPDFDHLGEQPIYNQELYFGSPYVSNKPFDKETGEEGSVENGIFGYTMRYAEYKSSFSTVHGEFRTTLDNWHVSRDFDSTPALNTSFIKAEPEDFDRIFEFKNIENTSNEHFQMQIYLDVVAKRNMSKYSTPYTLY